PGTHGGGSGLLVDDELARAVRNESAAAVMSWWTASQRAGYHWRRALGVTRTHNTGTKRLQRAAAAKGAAATQARGWSQAAREARRRTTVWLNLGRYVRPGGGRALWSAADVALLGKLPDEEVARRLGALGRGRPRQAVQARHPDGKSVRKK